MMRPATGSSDSEIVKRNFDVTGPWGRSPAKRSLSPPKHGPDEIRSGLSSRKLEHLDEAVDYDNLAKLGSIMGSGGLVIIDDSTSMPDFANFFMDFCVDESCGKCLPCRVGTVQIRELLDKIIAGQGTAALELLEEVPDLDAVVAPVGGGGLMSGICVAVNATTL